MGILEQVMDLKGKGISDQEIIGKLKEQGISPKEINNALSQARIKEAVFSEGTNTADYSGGNEEETPSMMAPEEAETLPTEGSISDEDLMPPPSPLGPQQYPKKFEPMHKEVSEEYVPQPYPKEFETQGQEQYPQYPSYQQQYGAGNYPQEYTGGGEGYETGYQGYTPQGVSDTDTIIEIAGQVFSEKTKTIQKQLEELNEFKVLMQTKIDNMSDRLKRIEVNIDTLQAEILERIGSYGRGIEGVKKEMTMMQESFGKIVNTLADKAGEKHKHEAAYHPIHHRIEKKVTVTHKSSKKKKNSKKKK